MGETPEDVLLTAAALVSELEAHCFKEKVFLGTVNAKELIREYAAKAILAERERCAKIAEGPAEAWGEFPGGTPERDRIAAAIRSAA